MGERLSEKACEMSFMDIEDSEMANAVQYEFMPGTAVKRLRVLAQISIVII